MNGFDRAGLSAVLEHGAGEMRAGLNSAQIGKLIDYLGLLVKWNAVYNLTAVREPAKMVTQHLLDSLALVPLVASAQNILDVGAGAGLPGIVLAIARVEAHTRVALVDTVHKKTAFLTQVKAELGLSNVTVYTSRVERLQVAEKFDAITSRAFASLSDFVGWSNHLLADGGRFVAMKGAAPTAEMDSLPPGWQVSEVVPLPVPGLNAERHAVIVERA